MKPRILIAGIGNIFLGDDGFGVEVIRQLQGKLPDTVDVADFGIRGFDLAFALMDGYDTAILVDATKRGGAPGSLYTIEPDFGELDSIGEIAPDAHSLDPVKVLALTRLLGGNFKRILTVGCEPASCGDEEGGRIGLTTAVEAAVPEAVRAIESLVERILRETAAESMVARPRSEQSDFDNIETGGRI